MHGSAAAGWLLVALCAATGAYCLLRMRSRVEEQRRSAGGEALMGFGMAAMALPAVVVTPPRWAWLGCVVVFGGAGVRALWAARTGAHHLHHLIGALAMVYMAWAMAAAPATAHAAHATASGTPPVSPGSPLLTGALLLYFAGYVIWSGVRLLPLETAVAGPVGGPHRRGTNSSGTQSGGTQGSGIEGSGIEGGWADRPEVARACRLSMGIGMLAMLLAV
ncbi:DUF5134 domain-containing protein [Streptomyces cavernae]|uniref:DUF5134 domain-containing protein n=1 Tax=Streptomyces cavernae TaxID=2259034 RepID=UPI00192E3FB3|nr:DUF5134 domain-containing protein [Streptomyces cavernae]